MPLCSGLSSSHLESLLLHHYPKCPLHRHYLSLPLNPKAPLTNQHPPPPPPLPSPPRVQSTTIAGESPCSSAQRDQDPKSAIYQGDSPLVALCVGSQQGGCIPAGMMSTVVACTYISVLKHTCMNAHLFVPSKRGAGSHSGVTA